MWIKPGGCVTPKSEAIWRTEWTEARVRDWNWIAVLLFGGESDSWGKEHKLFNKDAMI